MTEELVDKQLQSQYLDKIEAKDQFLKDMVDRFYEAYNQEKKEFVELVEEAKFESDLSISEVATHLGKTRQALNKVIVDVLGVRHKEKAAAAREGHRNRKVSVG